MSFRSLAGMSVLLCAIAVPVAAHADTITWTPDTAGPALTFTIDAAHPTTVSVGDYVTYDVTATNGDALIVGFYTAAFDAILQTALPASGYGNFDMIISDSTALYTYQVDGPQLYTGSELSPELRDGTFRLTGDPNSDAPIDATQSGTLTITPEPSSWMLLGTGLLALAGVGRRRWAMGS